MFDGELVSAASVAYAPPCCSLAARGLADRLHEYLGYEREPIPYTLVLDPATVP